MPLPTFQRLRQLAEAGATVLFAGGHAADVPGLGALADRRSELRAALVALGPGEALAHKVRRWRLGRGRFLLAPDARTALAAAGVRREPMADLGLSVLRRQVPPSRSGGHLYFLSNLGARPFEGWVPLATPAAAGLVMDALSGEVGLGTLRPRGGRCHGDVPGARAGPVAAGADAAGAASAARFRGGGGRPPPARSCRCPGPWEIRFVRGGPIAASAGSHRGTRPVDQPRRPRPACVFRAPPSIAPSSTCRPRPATTRGWCSRFAGVYAVATVRLNGQVAGMLWSLPFRLDVRRQLRAWQEHPGDRGVQLARQPRRGAGPGRRPTRSLPRHRLRRHPLSPLRCQRLGADSLGHCGTGRAPPGHLQVASSGPLLRTRDGLADLPPDSRRAAGTANEDVSLHASQEPGVGHGRLGRDGRRIERQLSRRPPGHGHRLRTAARRRFS